MRSPLWPWTRRGMPSSAPLPNVEKGGGDKTERVIDAGGGRALNRRPVYVLVGIFCAAVLDGQAARAKKVAALPVLPCRTG